MAFSRVNTSGWAVGDKLSSAQMNALDIQLTKALDKTAAGDTISGPVNVGSGGSLGVTGTGTIALSGAGGLVTVGPFGSIIINTPGGISLRYAGALTNTVDNAIKLGGSVADWIQFGTPRAHTVTVNLAAVAGLVTVASPGTTSASWTYTVGGNAVNASGVLTPFGAGVSTNYVYSANTSTAYGFVVPLDAYLHNGSTLSSATLSYATATHASLPARYPSFCIFSLPINPTPAQLTAALSFSTSTPLATAWATDGAATVSAYSAVSRALSLSCTQNNVINRSANMYFALVADEGGSNSVAGNTFVSIALNQTGITSSAFA